MASRPLLRTIGARAARGSRRASGGRGARSSSGLEASFEQHWSEAFGERWLALRAALAMPTEHVAWLNSFAQSHSMLASCHEVCHSSGCTLCVPEMPGGGDSVLPAPVMLPAPGAEELSSHYLLDGASPLPALRLAPRRGHRVLDLCAAPGGKSLVLAGQLFSRAAVLADDGSTTGATVLVSNDRSAARRARLRRVLKGYLPQRLMHDAHSLLPSLLAPRKAELEAVAVTGIDAAQWGRGMPWSDVTFDRILVDAPCSSERHFLHAEATSHHGGTDPAAAAVWSRGRLRRDAAHQASILRNAARLLAVGGRLVYATCSLDDAQNDGVVRKLCDHKRHGEGLMLGDALGGPLAEPSLMPLLAGAHRTSCGAIMLPDTSRFGPLYWAVLERRSQQA